MADAIPPWLTVARKYIGTEEIPGPASNPTIIGFIARISSTFPEQSSYAAEYKNDDIAWCGVFAADCFAEVGISGPFGPRDIDRWMWADAWMTWGKAIEPREGAVVCFGGHVGMINRLIDADTIEVIGGNQSSPQGGAVTLSRRRLSTVKACRWPDTGVISVPAPDERPEIKLGASGPFVIELQKLLGVAQTGVFDLSTDAAVRNFQALRGLEIDGEVGKNTWRALTGTPAVDVQYGAEYADQWRRMTILPEHAAAVDTIARKLIANKARYQAAQARTSVPWALIAVLHNRESDADFSTQLAQGDPLNRVSTNVPSGRGPFATWEDGAYDALVTLKHLDQIRDWSIERVAYESERYNGWGYRNKGVPSAYLWSFSNIYQGGKYIADHVWSSTARDKQCGTMPALRRMMELDASIQFGTAGIVIPPTNLDDQLFIALIFVLTQGNTMDANIKAAMIAELSKPNPDLRALLLQALGAPTTTPPPIINPPAPPPPPPPAFDYTAFLPLLQSPIVQQILGGKPITIAELLPLIPAILAISGGHPVPALPPPPKPPDPPPPPPVVPPVSPAVTNWSTGIGAALVSLGLSAMGVIGAPVGPDSTLTGMLLPIISLAAGAFGIPAPVVAAIGNIFSSVKGAATPKPQA